MVLQPLVESAIQHGIAKTASPGCIRITATRADDYAKIEIADNGAGLGNPCDEAASGVGLHNTRERLRQLYGARHEFHMEALAGKGCSVTLAIPWSEREAAGSK